MNETNHNDLEKTIEKIRQKLHPDLKKSLVEKIIAIETELQDDRTAAFKGVQQAIRDHAREMEKANA